jgi:hypothetical protein
MTEHEFAILKSLTPLERKLLTKVLGAYGEQPVCTALLRMAADRCTVAMESVQEGRRKGETVEGWRAASFMCFEAATAPTLTSTIAQRVIEACRVNDSGDLVRLILKGAAL